MPSFFRKERQEVFESRFNYNEETKLWSLGGEDIFICKIGITGTMKECNRIKNIPKNKLDFSLYADIKDEYYPVEVVYGANGNCLLFKGEKNKIAKLIESVPGIELCPRIIASVEGEPLAILDVTENQVSEIMNRYKRKILYEVISEIFRKHRNSSSDSPLISGCIENNFSENNKYKGYKLELDLKTRTPIKNPYCSGLEKEYFLIGDVKRQDCEHLYYHGWDVEGKGLEKGQEGSLM